MKPPEQDGDLIYVDSINGNWILRIIVIAGVCLVVVALFVALVTARRITREKSPSSALPEHALVCLGGTAFVTQGDSANLLAYSPSGLQLATLGSTYVGNSSPGVQIWETATGEEVGPSGLSDHDADWLDWSPTGEYLVVCDRFGEVKVWDVVRGECLKTLSDEKESRFNCVAWSSDGKWVAACQEMGTTFVWDVNNDWSRRDLKWPARSLAMAPNSKVLVAGLQQHVAVWDLITGETIQTLELSPLLNESAADDDDSAADADPEDSPRIQAVAISPDSQLLAIAGQRDLELRDLATREILDRKADVRAFTLAFHPDGQSLVTTPLGGPATIWEITRNRTLNATRTLPHIGYTATFSPDGQRLALASRRIVFVDTATWTPNPRFEAHASMIRSTLFTSDGHSVLSCDTLGSVRRWHIATGRQTQLLVPPTDVTGFLAMSSDDNVLASLDQQHNVVLWNPETGQIRATLDSSSELAPAIALSPAADRVAAIGMDGTVQLWDAQDQRLLASWKHPQEQALLGEIAFTPDGRLLAASFPFEQKIRLYDVEQLKETRTIAVGMSLFWLPLAFSSDGTLLATTLGSDVILVDVETAETVLSMRDPFESISRVAFSPDDALVAAAGRDPEGTPMIRVWSKKTGRLLLSFSGHDEFIRTLAFSPCGQMLVSGSQDSTILVWDLTAAWDKLAN